MVKVRTTAAVLGLTMLVAGCGDGPDEVVSVSARSSGAGSTSIAPKPTGEPKQYAAGDCYLDTHRTAKTDCGTPHELEVVAVLPDTEYADDPLRRYAHKHHRCERAGAEYTGGPVPGSLVEVAAMNTKSDPEGAATRIVCTAIVREPDTMLPRLMKRSLSGVLAPDSYDDYKSCYAKTTAKGLGKRVPCSDPHGAEAFSGSLWTGDPSAPHPGADTLDEDGLERCRKLGKGLIASGRKDIRITTDNANPSVWTTGIRWNVCSSRRRTAKPW